MVEGQMKDITTKEDFNLSELDLMHNQKTGELIKTSLEIGGLVAGLDLEKLSKLSIYGENIGLAFQITDDIIDIESPSEISGKDQGSDSLHNKTTYPALIGMEASKKRAKQLAEKAEQNLNVFSTKSTKLKKLAQFIIQRDQYEKEDKGQNSSEEPKQFTAYTTADGTGIKPRSFQMINAGLDRKLGNGEANRSGEDADNVAHFSRRLMGDGEGGTGSD